MQHVVTTYQRPPRPEPEESGCKALAWRDLVLRHPELCRNIEQTVIEAARAGWSGVVTWQATSPSALTWQLLKSPGCGHRLTAIAVRDHLSTLYKANVRRAKNGR